jgi:CDP-paratose 2-epimerase
LIAAERASTGSITTCGPIFFGPQGDTTWNLHQLEESCQRFEHHALDIRDRQGVFTILKETRPDLLIHCAAQPSHDLASSRPFDDFDVNAVGTLNLLEATRPRQSSS